MRSAEILDAIRRNNTNFSPAVAEAFRQIYGKKHQELNRTRTHRVVRENISYGPHERNVLDVYLPAEGASPASPASPVSPASSTPPASPSSPASPKSPTSLASPTSPASPPPSSSSPSSPGYNRPVMIYVHGGSLVAGDKVWYKGSLYANIGDYFASHGIITVIINYRLVPDVTYPGGAEDIQRAREWVYHNISKTEFGEGDPEKVVLVGHSAGGLHLATNLYLYPPELKPKPKPQKYPVQPESSKETSTSSNPPPPPPPIAGIVFISTPFEFDSDTFSPMPPHNTQFQTALKAYYGTQHLDEVHELSPIGLMMEKIPDDSPLLDPRKLPCLVVLAQYDPQGIQDPTFAFVDEYRRRSPQGVLPEFVVVGGHNHISHVCSIGTEDDVQGRMLREFIGRVC